MDWSTGNFVAMNLSFERSMATGNRRTARDLPKPAVEVQWPSTLDLLLCLTKMGYLDHAGLLIALADKSASQVRIADVLLSRGLIDRSDLYAGMGQLWSLSVIDPTESPADPRVLDMLGAEECLKTGLLPWRNLGGTTLILTPYPEERARHIDKLTQIFGPVAFALCPYSQLETAVLLMRGNTLAKEAETKVVADRSCRGWPNQEGKYLSGGLVFLAVLAIFFPSHMYFAALILGVTGLVPVIGLKLLALASSLLADRVEPAPVPQIARLPTVSIIVALYHESHIATRLIRRLARLDYPRDLLDVILAVEMDDHITRNALAQTELPSWMRVVIVPRGKVKTKPRALNFALNMCRGSIVGVYDAEDAPEADQIRKVVQRFHERGPKVACLQGVLDFYNPTANWLARCFTLEYGGWFRVILPGLDRLGLPIPLGGTTLFFRRSVLQELGGWDAHNVTEDADLGIRLAQDGYRTELIQTTTYEEANCRVVPWVKQRSRWIKGYMMTYVVHMRRPRQTLANLGIRGFLAFQTLFLGSLVQTFLSPILLSLLVVQYITQIGQTTPILTSISSVLLPLAILSELTGMAILAIGLKRSGQPISFGWIPTLSLYFPMAAAAAYKALWEAVMHPFYWDKTSHGHLSGAAFKPKAPIRFKRA